MRRQRSSGCAPPNGSIRPFADLRPTRLRLIGFDDHDRHAAIRRPRLSEVLSLLFADVGGAIRIRSSSSYFILHEQWVVT
jgi:hypothetical protein